jgi:uncharacterized protein YdhG (YjbR/CyaY superfamily)
MAKTDFNSVDEYVGAQPEAIRSVLACVRKTIRKALSGAEEVISYQIPAYRLHGKFVLYFRWVETALFALPRYRSRHRRI